MSETSYTILLSYPKSGNHFVRFLLEYISGRPSRGCYKNSKDLPVCSRKFANPTLLNHVNPKASSIVYKCHTIQEIRKFYPHQNKKLIFIIRNFRDAMYRFRKNLNLDQATHYLELVRYYHQFRGPKLIIYYEDLITNPQASVNLLTNFLRLKTDKLTYFMKHTEAVVADSKKCLSNVDSYRNIKQGQTTQTYETQVSSQELKTVTDFLSKQPESLRQYYNRYL